MPATPISNPTTATDVIVEVCVDSIESALAAETGGAQRVELCANLYEGGTTPSPGLMALARERLSIPVHVLVRPRGGDFLYDETELQTLLGDIAFAKGVGVAGVVLGTLNPDGAVDDRSTRALIEAARPLSITFHRAFDLVRDPFEALDTLMALGVDRVLTSGGAPTALAGLETLAALAWRSEGRGSIIAAGGLTEHDVGRVIGEAGVHEVHVRPTRRGTSPMRFRRESVTLGKPYVPDEYARVVTTAEMVRQVVKAVADASAPAGTEPVTG
ncbi:MAG TPA: copper homeostasis protein CutC [Gemmatimonadaceae bacterium]|nr:copper homeostasis protein CutC [Gemmatimonadaceae bacterium]